MNDTSPSEQIVQQPTPGPCECIQKTDEALAKHNTVLGVNWQHKNGRLIQTIAIVTEVATKKRGARPIRMIPNYCPICGQRYQQSGAGHE